jgi:hypothetical protein
MRPQASDLPIDAAWITGECMKVDGGRFMTSLR